MNTERYTNLRNRKYAGSMRELDLRSGDIVEETFIDIDTGVVNKCNYYRVVSKFDFSSFDEYLTISYAPLSNFEVINFVAEHA